MITLYVRQDGNDSTGDGSLGNPFLTAQVAFSTAYFDTDEYILDFGEGTFSGIDLNLIAAQYRETIPDDQIRFFVVEDHLYYNYDNSYTPIPSNNPYRILYYENDQYIIRDDGNNYITSSDFFYEGRPYPWNVSFGTKYIPLSSLDWPDRIALKGVSPETTIIEGITGFEEDSLPDPNSYLIQFASKGSTINLNASSIKINEIILQGGGASSFVYDYGYPSVGRGGSLTASNIAIDTIVNNGGNNNYSITVGDTPIININNCIVTTISSIGCTGDPGLVGGSINVINSVVANIDARGGDSSAASVGGNGGNVTIINSKVDSVNVNGGVTAYQYTGGAGGSVTVVNSTVVDGISAIAYPYTTNDSSTVNVTFIGKNTIPKNIYGNTDFNQIILVEKENAIAISQLLRLPFPINI